jgi:hypothetical protein
MSSKLVLSPVSGLPSTQKYDDLKLMDFSIVQFSTDQATQLQASLLLRARHREQTRNSKLSASR